jgi:hypothetical protein
VFRSGREEPKRKCKVGDMFEMEGYDWIVVEADGVEVKSIEWWKQKERGYR